jgi:iron complex transport system ATP-binding protein
VALLATSGLDIRIGSVKVCRRLELHVNAGERWAILGRNGTGKTTLLHTLAGLRRPDSGTVKLDGEALDTLPRRHIARRVGVLLQDHLDAFPASVLETALIGRHPYLGALQWEGPDDYALARTALHAVGLDGLEDRNVATLSGGERRRLGIATLLTQDPALWLLDEPTNHLDVHQQIRILDLLQARSQSGQKTLLLVMHDLNLALRFCDRFLLLFGAGETAQGSADAVLTRATLERLYEHPMHTLDGPHGPVWLPG